MIKRIFPYLVMGLLISGAGAPLAAQATPSATQSVSFRVERVTALWTCGAPGRLVIQPTDPDQPPEPAVDSTTTYAITTNDPTATITMSLDEAMPRDLTLSVELAAPSRLLAAGRKALSESERSVVVGGATSPEEGLRIVYELSADASVEPQSVTRTVTLTIVGGP